MGIPTFDQMMRPVLELGTREPVSRKSATAAMEEHFGMSAEERAARIPSGHATYVRHRVGWAMTDLLKAGLWRSAARRFIAPHPRESRFFSGIRAASQWPTSAHLPAFQAWKRTFGTKNDNEPEDDEVQRVEKTDAARKGGRSSRRR